MFRTLLLVLEPFAAWEKIFLARRSLVVILLTHLLPLLLIASVCEGYGLVRWGKARGQEQEIAHVKPFTKGQAVVFETGHFLLSLMLVFVGANMVKSIGETFHGRHTYLQAFTAVAYGLSPLFLLRVFDAFPSINPWVPWSVGIFLSSAALYHGIPKMMEPDPPHAFGLFMMGSLLIALIGALVRFVTWWYLIGKLPKVEEIISDIAARLPF
jgi:hypothetical protein